MAGEIPGTGVHGAAESGDVTMPQATLPDMLDVQELKSIIEAMLFVSQEPLSLDRLATREHVDLRELFGEEPTIGVVISVIVALLELARLGHLRLAQPEPYGPVGITRESPH